MPYRGTQSGLWWRQRMDQHNILCKISSQIIVTTCQRPAASDFLAAVYSDLGEDGLQQFVLSQHFILATAALAAGHSFCSIIYTFNPGSAAAGEVPLRGYGQQFHGKLVCSDQIELGSVWRITLSMMLISKPYGSTMQYAKFKMKSVIFQGDVGEVTQSVAQDETKGGK
uniref:Uncharacterized protein n=1 Tax=Oryza meridionalis TaxID=40149 RepID=A0A0E0EJD7_9ORYZ